MLLAQLAGLVLDFLSILEFRGHLDGTLAGAIELRNWFVVRCNNM